MTTPTTAQGLRAMAAKRRCDACGNTFCGGATEALTWAADEIERLERALKDIKTHWYTGDDAREVAEDALEAQP